ncbi:isochorismate synthase [Mycobacterium botniense]|uniref:isochorismate synthase n=1 Tax=Mycobacterium botniense TaxID=84962 RepID=A0A7I9XS94_9MYCO|nr:isochorismate synthase [Mycobacterium botniense]GFG72862.1 putative isochorismate synthase MenF [Mycobacterium botniense]
MKLSQPPFVLCGPTGTLIADGVQARYADVTAAQAMMRSGSQPMLLGALPFNLDSPAALMVPRAVQRTAAPPDWPTGPLPAVRIAAEIPAPEEHRARIRRAHAQLAAPDTSLHKVVLARALRLVADAPLDGRVILARLLAADPAAYGYLVDLTAAGGEYSGAALVGASPELLVARDGERVICQPFAGSAPRCVDADLDAATGSALAASVKDRHEHQLVVDAVREVLRPLCRQMTIPAQPRLRRTAAVWHLCTPITARINDISTTALDLALALHPTPAVGGVPADVASNLIATLEGDRGFYAGAVGWCDGHGNGEWVVSIRCAQLAPDGCSTLVHAGGGIVAESNPDDELNETTIKFGTILTALGVQR